MLDGPAGLWFDGHVEQGTAMSRTARRGVAGALSALAVMVVGAGLAWACTPAAYLFLSKTGAAPGTTITISGKEFAPGPVEIEWTGAPAAERTMATGPSFSVPVAVPDIEPGVYYVQATALDDFGGIEGQATRAFKVSVPAPAPTPGRTEARPEPAPNAVPAPRGRAEARSQAPANAAPLAPSRAPAPAVIAPRTPAAAPATDAPSTPAAREPEREAVSTPPPPSSARTSSQRSVVADLWSGFAAGPESSLPPSTTTTATSAGASGSRMLGIALLGTGLVVMLGGFVVAGLRRRRAPARR